MGKTENIIVTGGAGFVGSHLVDKLLEQGHNVTVIDNLFTGQKRNLAQWHKHSRFTFYENDVATALPDGLQPDKIYHLACPASPPHYQLDQVKTIETCVLGTLNVLKLAHACNSRVLLASTSEIYGDPEVHPQPESYKGNVNTFGPRACYDEGKRIGEAMMYAYHAQRGVDVRIARIFNTYGPRMRHDDGRVISNFVVRALQGKALEIYGDGKQTRSFQYISDLVDGLVKLMDSEDVSTPINLGNPDEFTISELAGIVLELTESKCDITFKEKPVDDPMLRRPDITRAKSFLNWEPKVKLREGLTSTIQYFVDRGIEG